MAKVYRGVGRLMIEVEASELEEIAGELLEQLEVGDLVIKKTGAQKHAYYVTYRGEGIGEGVCFTYSTTGYSETISYDKTAEGWKFNSKDVWQAE